MARKEFLSAHPSAVANAAQGTALRGAIWNTLSGRRENTLLRSFGETTATKGRQRISPLMNAPREDQTD